MSDLVGPILVVSLFLLVLGGQLWIRGRVNGLVGRRIRSHGPYQQVMAKTGAVYPRFARWILVVGLVGLVIGVALAGLTM